MTITRTVAVVAMTAGLMLAGESVRAQPLDGRTLPALRLAHASEVAAQREYAAYAERAEHEGYLGVRDLYRALAQCEAEHAARHAHLLALAGETAAATAPEPVVGTTRENLASAFTHERNERRVRYARLANAVRPELAYDVLASLQWCAVAEATHARALAGALESIEDLRSPRTWYACPECGCLRAEHTSERCACGMSASTLLALGGGVAPPAEAAQGQGSPVIAGLGSGLGIWRALAVAEMQR